MAHTIAQDGVDGHAEGVGYVHKILYAYLVSRIKICAAEEQIRKNVSGAQAEFIRHCRIRNLSLRTIAIRNQRTLYD